MYTISNIFDTVVVKEMSIEKNSILIQARLPLSMQHVYPLANVIDMGLPGLFESLGVHHIYNITAKNHSPTVSCRINTCMQHSQGY